MVLRLGELACLRAAPPNLFLVGSRAKRGEGIKKKMRDGSW